MFIIHYTSTKHFNIFLCYRMSEQSHMLCLKSCNQNKCMTIILGSIDGVLNLLFTISMKQIPVQNVERLSILLMELKFCRRGMCSVQSRIYMICRPFCFLRNFTSYYCVAQCSCKGLHIGSTSTLPAILGEESESSRCHSDEDHHACSATVDLL